MIEPGEDYAGEVADANRYITDPEDPAPKQKGLYRQDWESGRTVDLSDPERIAEGICWGLWVKIG